MSQSNDILAPRLVVADSHQIEYINDCVQDVASDCESLAYALNMIETHDPASKGIVVAVRTALLANHKYAAEISIMLSELVLLPQVEVSSDA